MKSNLKGKRVVIYIRVSTAEQKDFGNSLRIQRKRIEEFCDMYKMQVVIVFEEDHSAKNFLRPEFQKLKTYVKANKKYIDYILVHKWDRFSRNVGKALSMIEHFKKQDIEINSIENWIDYNIPDHIVMLSIYLSTPEAENSKIRERSISGTRETLKQGRYCKMQPKGYMKGIGVDGKPLMQPDPTTAPLIKELFKDYATNLYTQQDLLKKYNTKGLDITKSSLSRLLDNVLYMGMVKVPTYKEEPEVLVEGKHISLISKDLFNVVQGIKHGRKGFIKKKKSRNDSFPLTGFLKCAECGQTIYGSRTNNGKKKKKTKTYNYYQCNSKCKCKRYRTEIVHRELGKLLKTIKPSNVMLELFQQILIDEYKKTKQSRLEDKIIIDEKIKHIKATQSKVTKKFAIDAIDESIYEQIMHDYKIELTDLNAASLELLDYQKDLDTLIIFGTNLLANLDKFYNDANIDVKTRLLSSIFVEKLEFFDKSFRTHPFNDAISLLCRYNKAFRRSKTKKGTILSNNSLKVLKAGIEPALPKELDFESNVSTNSTT